MCKCCTQRYRSPEKAPPSRNFLHSSAHSKFRGPTHSITTTKVVMYVGFSRHRGMVCTVSPPVDCYVLITASDLALAPSAPSPGIEFKRVLLLSRMTGRGTRSTPLTVLSGVYVKTCSECSYMNHTQGKGTVWSLFPLIQRFSARNRATSIQWLIKTQMDLPPLDSQLSRYYLYCVGMRLMGAAGPLLLTVHQAQTSRIPILVFFLRLSFEEHG